MTDQTIHATEPWLNCLDPSVKTSLLHRKRTDVAASFHPSRHLRILILGDDKSLKASISSCEKYVGLAHFSRHGRSRALDSYYVPMVS